LSDNVTRRGFIGAVGTAAAISALGPRATAQQQDPPAAVRPNVLFILADDLGYGDLSCYGRPDYDTPELDALASQGLKFTSNYSAAPVCTPTRCAFITGRYPQRLRVGLEEPLGGASPEVGIPDGHPTIATQMRAAGYATALIGKWHLGWKPEFNPTRHGFDEFFGALSGALDYFTHLAPDSGSTSLPDLWENETRVAHDGYLTDLFTDRAIDYITRPREQPFYLSLHYNAPHSPWEGPGDAGIDHTRHGVGPMTDGGSLGTYAKMMRSMDLGVGRVLAALERAGLERNTLVIFTSDNGGERYSYNWPFSFQKLYLNEGGIRVPAIVRWPGVVAPQRTTEQPAITMDWTATILAAAGAQPGPRYPLDGESLLPTLRGERDVYERTFFWRTRTREAARIGNWKYVKDGEAQHLYDLGLDLGEKNALEQTHADVFARVRKQYDAWAAEMLPRRMY
jgi:arylsulfatase A-like enzyme